MLITIKQKIQTTHQTQKKALIAKTENLMLRLQLAFLKFLALSFFRYYLCGMEILTLTLREQSVNVNPCLI